MKLSSGQDKSVVQLFCAVYVIKMCVKLFLGLTIITAKWTVYHFEMSRKPGQSNKYLARWKKFATGFV